MKNLFQSTFRIQKCLTESGIPSVVIGGIAVAVWGEPRLTRDVDLKVLLERNESKRLMDILKTDYQCLADNPEKTLEKSGFIFVKDSDGIRLDLLLADTPFDKKVVNRGRLIDVEPGVRLVLSTPEDLILYKMISVRPRDREDVRGIIRRQGKSLDNLYIRDWLEQFEKALDDSTLLSEYLRMCRP